VEGSSEDGNEPWATLFFWKFFSSCVTGGFSGWAQLVCWFLVS
jgi:hypothetical protein